MRKVCITGLGTINSVGLDVTSTWENLLAGKLGICTLDEELQTATKVKFGGKINDYDGTNYFGKKELRRLDLTSQFALIASREAACDAKLEEISDRTRIGVNVTSGIGGINTIEDNISKANRVGFGKISPMFIPNAIINLISGNVAIDLKCQGLCIPPVTACASSTDAIGHAAMYIQNGLVDVMVTGGSEAAINKTGLAGFQNMGALSTSDVLSEACIPFDKKRSGFVMGEGAATLILEEYEHAKARGAKIYGFVSGYGATCDASHITAPAPLSKMGIKAVKTAISNANIDVSEIGYINAHGTSTSLNDKGESYLISEVFGKTKPVVTSSKSMTGHLLGATGALEAIVTVLSLKNQVCTPTIGTNDIDEQIDIDICINHKKQINCEYGLSTSLGFGGHNSAIIIERGYDDIK